jgi:hypothetical protein
VAGRCFCDNCYLSSRGLAGAAFSAQRDNSRIFRGYCTLMADEIEKGDRGIIEKYHGLSRIEG